MKLSECFNWKLLVGLLGTGVLLYFIAPGIFTRLAPFAPFLIFLICPLSMLFFMKGMNSCQTPSDQTDETNKKRMFSCPECLLQYEDKEWAEKCLAWCKEHHSCNIEITRHAVSK